MSIFISFVAIFCKYSLCYLPRSIRLKWTFIQRSILTFIQRIAEQWQGGSVWQKTSLSFFLLDCPKKILHNELVHVLTMLVPATITDRSSSLYQMYGLDYLLLCNDIIDFFFLLDRCVVLARNGVFMYVIKVFVVVVVIVK